MAPECDLVIVVGSSNSSNAARLVEVSVRGGAVPSLIDDETQLRLEWFRPARTIGVTAAASSPPQLVDTGRPAMRGIGRQRSRPVARAPRMSRFPYPWRSAKWVSRFVRASRSEPNGSPEAGRP